MSTQKPRKEPAVPRPSSSVVLISPSNQILLLHRVSTSSSFASAHVFPGGNVDKFHDGESPAPDHPDRHQDSAIYRLAAIRETFEESGILLAKDKNGRQVQVSKEDREKGRVAVHDSKVAFPEWLEKQGGVPDVDGLIPFTRWVTPPPLPKRFTTQMYLYFMPLPTPSGTSSSTTQPTSNEPTHDGGKEHTTAEFLPPSEWLNRSRSNSLILFPPQFTLIHLCAQFLNPDAPNALSPQVLQEQRDELIAFARGGDPPWKEVCICPLGLGKGPDGRMVLSLEGEAPELKGSGRKGCKDYVVLVEPTKAGFRNLEVVTKKELEEMKKEKKGGVAML